MGTKHKGTTEEESSLNAFINLMRCTNSLRARLSRSFTENELTESQFGVLETIYHLGPLFQKELAEKLLVSGGNMTFVIDNLEKRGLVKRVRNDDDRRFYKVELTEKGKNKISKLFPSHVKTVVEEFNCLSEKERKSLREICKKLGKKQTNEK